MAMLTTRGLYNYSPSIFAGLTIPEMWDRETLIGCILQATDEREVLYANPEVFAANIGIWAAANADNWQRLAKALAVEYEPLENFDRKEEWDDNTDDKRDTTLHATGDNTGHSDSEGVTKATGYNSGALVDTGGDKSTANTRTHSDQTNKEGVVGNVKSRHTGRMHGNIGVTTSQQMLQSEIDLRKYNWYYATAEDFKQRFTLGVW